MIPDQLLRENFKQLICSSGVESFASISRLLGRNAAYAHQYVTRGSPARLNERDRKLIVRYFGVDEESLGEANDLTRARTVPVRCLLAETAPGGDRCINGEFAVAAYGFDPAWLRRVRSTAPENLSIITVSGDPISPHLGNGEDLLVDCSDAGSRLRDGIYVLRRDGTLLVTRLARAAHSGTFKIASYTAACPL